MSSSLASGGCCRDTPSPPLLEKRSLSLTSVDDVYLPRISSKQNPPTPPLVHRWKYTHSIMSLATNDSHVYAGTESGHILVYDLETYQLKATLPGHNGSVYSLILTKCTDNKDNNNQKSDLDFLISGSSDSLIKVWSLSNLTEVYTIYSIYDIGDIFSLAWSPEYQILFFGAKNASIQWIKLDNKNDDNIHTKNDPSGLPSYRFDKFFDSIGPGGRLAPQQNALRKSGMPSSAQSSSTDLAQFETNTSVYEGSSILLEVLPSNIVRFAHNGYVNSMLITKMSTSTTSSAASSAVSLHSNSGSKKRSSSLHGCGQEILISGAGDGSVKIWNIINNKGSSSLHLLRSLELENSVMSMIRGCDSFVYCGLSTGQVVMYDIDTSQVLRVDKQESSDVMALCTVGDCVFKGTAGLVQKWDPSKYLRSEWTAHKGLTLAMVSSSFNPARPVLVTGGNDSTIAVWDITSTVNNDSSNGGVVGDSAINNNNSPTTSTKFPGKLVPMIDHHLPKVVALDNDNMIKTLSEFVSYKTISGKDLLYWTDSRRCASYLRSLLSHFGASSQLLAVQPNGNPIVYGCFHGVSEGQDDDSSVNNTPHKKKRILFYGHYDVITASQADKWDTDPFDLTALDGYLYGRGVSDNKGPILAAVFAVAELFQSSQLQNDVIFLIEGEEECGSTGFSETIVKNKDLIGDIDWIILSNSYWLDDTNPCLNYGLRGIINASISIGSNKPDLHSGVHGGVYREPTVDMVNLLAKLTSDDGKILIPRFYESVRKIDEAEEKLYDAIINTPGVTQDKEVLMKKWRYPSMTIHGVKVSGPGNATVIPASVVATISFRVVPDQDLDQIKHCVRQYLEESFAKFSSDNELSITFSHEAEPWLGDPSNEPFQILRQALRDEWQIDPLFIREGGSIPVVRILEKIFDAPAAQLPCGQSSDGAHLNNERLRITNFFKTRNVFKRVFVELRGR